MAHEDRFGNEFVETPYDAEIAYVDAEIGRLISSLEKSGVLERTIVVVVGDHGESLGEHGELSHGMTVYDATLRVPLRLAGTVAMQARTVVPLTSISQAPQLPPRQPVGMARPASRAAASQSVPDVTVVVLPPGQWICTCFMGRAATAPG
jgi:arylsulfatase A-like enzyme